MNFIIIDNAINLLFRDKNRVVINNNWLITLQLLMDAIHYATNGEKGSITKFCNRFMFFSYCDVDQLIKIFKQHVQTIIKKRAAKQRNPYHHELINEAISSHFII